MQGDGVEALDLEEAMEEEEAMENQGEEEALEEIWRELRL